MPETAGNIHDTAIPIQVQLFRGSTPFDATGIPLANIVFKFRVVGEVVATVAAETADDAATGKFSVTPPAAVRGAARKYAIAVTVTDLAGLVQTFPDGIENRYTHTIRPV